MSDIPLDEVIHFDVISSASTGAAADADSTPTFSVYEEATDTEIGVGGNLTKRTSLTGNYRGSFTASAANGFELGKWYNVIASATVGGIAAKAVAMRFRIVAAEATAGVPEANVKSINNVSTSSVTAVSANVGTAQPVNFTGTGSTAYVKAGLWEILGTVLTETSGLIAAGFKKFFNVATPTGTVNSLPDAVAGAANGLLIAGSNAATTFNGLTTGAFSCSTFTASGAVAFQSTFAVTTSTSLGAVSCTTLTASGAVAFQSTFAVTTSTSLAALSCTTLTASGAVALQSTLTVTGATSLAAVSTSGTVTMNALTVTNATTLSGAVSLGSTLGITGTTTFAAMNGTSINITNSAGDAVSLNSTGSNGHGLYISGNGGGDGLHIVGGATGHGLHTQGGSTSGDGIHTTAQTLGDGLDASGAGGGVDIRGGITGNITGNLSGSAGSVTGGATASNQTTIINGISSLGSPMQAGSTVVLTDASLTTAKLGAFSLAKTTNITGFNDIAATAVVSNGAITTSGGAVTTVTTTGTATALGANAVTAAALATDAGTEIAAAILDLTDGVETGLTLRQAMRLIAAANAGKLSGAATTTIVIRNAVADSKDRVTATVDSSGNRSAIVLDLT